MKNDYAQTGREAESVELKFSSEQLDLIASEDEPAPAKKATKAKARMTFIHSSLNLVIPVLKKRK